MRYKKDCFGDRIDLCRLNISELINNGELICSTGEIYIEVMSAKLGMSPKALYLFVKRYIAEICLDTELQEFPPELPTTENNDKSLDESWTEDSFIIKSNDLLKFEVNITGKDLFPTKLVVGTENNRKRLRRVLEPGWNEEIVEIIWNEKKN